MSLKIAVTAVQDSLVSQAKSLAAELNLPFTEETKDFSYVLKLCPKHLGLVKIGVKLKPLIVDFLSGKLAYRREHASLRNEALARALGLNHQESPIILDATGGLGRDSFILASLGFKIYILERSPILFALLRDGIMRALGNKHVAPIVERLLLFNVDAKEWLRDPPVVPDLVYMDPMFPHRQKTALVKKEMQFLQDVIGEDEDALELFNAAFSCAKKRVVVKRPRLATSLIEKAPNFSLQGASSRFDVYLK